jgi:DNA-binding MarR family transcriptional regulator
MPRPRKSPAEEAQELYFRIGMVERLRAAADLAALGLTFSQALTLRALEPGEARPMKDVARDIPTDTSTFTGLADRLEQRSLITRQTSGSDRRVKLISLTRDGEALRARALAIMLRPPAAITALPAADQRALRDILRCAVDLMEEPSTAVRRTADR